ncbi:lysophospholipid acyltransferase 2-like [Lineus longissimus]|uniref:lysophospholipid acyltransferase 2-like n=1 Tax=Lineus longissimus TaxID=88925 RepID=UPI00315D1CDE
MFIQSIVCYAIMRLSPPDMMHKLMFVFSILYLSVMHIERQIFDYGVWQLDVTGPLMISTQKLTTLAFSIHDGMIKDKSKYTEEQKKRSISSPPSALEFFSYLFYFHGVIIGPFCFYDEYVEFVEGRQFDRALKEKDVKQKDFKEPTPVKAVMYKLMVAMINLTIWFTLAQWYPKKQNADADFIADNGFIIRFIFLLFSVFFSRAKYYFAWSLGEAISNSAGIGFNGFDKNGDAKWDLVKNVDIYELETATSFRTLIANWNIQTTNWLGYCVYTRAPYWRTFLTYGLSAVWHGFYPGYYLSFIGGAMFTTAARNVRRTVRPYFVTSKLKHQCYDVATWFMAQLALAYFVVPFTVLELVPSLRFFHNMYWFLHIATILVLIYPTPRSPRREKKDPTEVANGPKVNGGNTALEDSTGTVESNKKTD